MSGAAAYAGFRSWKGTRAVRPGNTPEPAPDSRRASCPVLEQGSSPIT
jgi:hypothetical protein